MDGCLKPFLYPPAFIESPVYASADKAAVAAPHDNLGTQQGEPPQDLEYVLPLNRAGGCQDGSRIPPFLDVISLAYVAWNEVVGRHGSDHEAFPTIP